MPMVQLPSAHPVLVLVHVTPAATCFCGMFLLQLEREFEELDVDHDGFITAEDLVAASRSAPSTNKPTAGADCSLLCLKTFCVCGAWLMAVLCLMD